MEAWSQDGWVLAKFFFLVFMDWDRVGVHEHTKKEPAILTEQSSIKDILYGFRGNFVERGG